MSKLRVVCITVAILILISIAFYCFQTKGIDVLTAVMLAVVGVGYLALLVGAILENVRLVLVAFIINLVLTILSVITILVNYFKTGNTSTWFDQLISLVLDLILIYVNYAYYNELHGSGDD